MEFINDLAPVGAVIFISIGAFLFIISILYLFLPFWILSIRDSLKKINNSLHSFRQEVNSLKKEVGEIHKEIILNK